MRTLEPKHPAVRWTTGFEQSVSSQSQSCPAKHGQSSPGPDRLSISGPGLDTRAEVDQDGRIDLWMDHKTQVKTQMLGLPDDYAVPVKEFGVDKSAQVFPIMNIVIFLVGSRGWSPVSLSE